jgi:hypothetical protein
VTTDQQHDIPAAPTGDPAIIGTLRRLYANATAEADRLASLGGHEREEAEKHLTAAAAADEAAMAARAYAERWRLHLAMELGAAHAQPEMADERRAHPYGELMAGES